MEQQLAINGGAPVRTAPLPNVGDSSGRDLGDQEIKNLTEAVKTGKLFRYGGHFVQEFEQGFAEMLGVKHAVAVTSGTAALHVAIATVNPNPGDEIITTPVTDMGTIAPILMQNAIPVFADLDPDYYTMLPESIEEKITDRTKAILVVHLFGHPADMDPILEIGRRHNIPVIEDCAQAYLAEYKGRLAGSMGDIACFSMQQSKHATAGDGGILVMNNDDYAARARLFSDKGWTRDPGGPRDYIFLGINYRMNELTGAVACAQLGKVRSVVDRRRAAAEKMTEAISKIQGINTPKTLPDCKHSYWLYTITIDESIIKCTPQEFAAALTAEGVGTGVGYIGKPMFESQVIHDRATYGTSHCPFDCPKARNIEYKEADYPNTMEILRTIMPLGINEFFSEGDIADIANAIAKVADFYRNK